MRIATALYNLEKALSREGIMLKGMHITTIDPRGIETVFVNAINKEWSHTLVDNVRHHPKKEVTLKVAGSISRTAILTDE